MPRSRRDPCPTAVFRAARRLQKRPAMRRLLAAATVLAALCVAPQARACDGGDSASSSISDKLGALVSDLGHVLSPWCGPGTYGESGWQQRAGGTTRDAGDAFATALSETRSHLALPASAHEPRWLVVGGLFTKHYPGYMEANVDRLKGLGLDVTVVPVDTEGSVEKNAEIVARWIRAATLGGRKVAIVGHSKGGVDITAALALHPELASRVEAVVTLQSPYGGTPLASDLQTCTATNWMTRKFVDDVLGGDVHSITDLGFHERQAFIAAHPYPADRVRTIAVATTGSSYRSTVGLTEWYMDRRYGIHNDGMVPVPEAQIPGGELVTLDGMDHAESTFSYFQGSVLAGDLTEALVRVVAAGIKPASSAATDR